MAHSRTGGAARRTLQRVGTPDLTPTDIASLQQALVDCGVVDEVEERIGRHVAAALGALHSDALDADGVRQLSEMAQTIAWRDA